MTNGLTTCLQKSFQSFVEGAETKKFMSYVYSYMNKKKEDFSVFLCRILPQDPKSIYLMSKVKPKRIIKSALVLKDDDEISLEDDDHEMNQVPKKNVLKNSIYYNSGNKVRYVVLVINTIILHT
jgi:hypothetical protein